MTRSTNVDPSGVESSGVESSGVATSEPVDELPPAVRSMWRLLVFGYRHERRLLVVTCALAVVSALPDAFVALWLKFLGEAVLTGNGGLLLLSAIGLGLTATATWLMRVVAARTNRRFRDRMTITLESHIAQVQASIATIAHQERPEYLDRLAVLRDEVFVLERMYESLFSLAGWIVRLGVVVGLLMTVHPALALLAVCTLPAVFTSIWRPTVERAAEERGAAFRRLARSLYVTATTSGPGKEIRVTGIGSRLVTARTAAWNSSYKLVAAARRSSAVWHSAAWAVSGGGFVGAVVFVSAGLRARPDEVLLVVAAAAQLSGYIGAAVGEVGFLRGIWMDGARRLSWLEDYARSAVTGADRPAPTALTKGIRLEDVSFAYPGTTVRVLQNVTLDLPAGSVVAIVGENGAGKSTLVKLLCKLYEPVSGRILVDGVPLNRIDTEQWRSRLSGAFQDFFRFELRAGRSVGLGDLTRLDDEQTVLAAVDRGGARDVVNALPHGLDTQLGPTWSEGADLSFGQWQKVALARGFMRDSPLLLVFDEPSAALDADTEYALFERYAAAFRSTEAMTILVSHRFSTVRMADMIVVLDGARVAETGSHHELMALGGLYARLYTIQAEAYAPGPN